MSPNIDPAAQSQLEQTGFVLVPQAIPAELIERWREIADEYECQALAAHADGEHVDVACVIEDPVGPRLIRRDDIFGSHPEELLELLACPALLDVAQHFCGPTAVPLQADILYKHQHPHPLVEWHQGPIHDRSHPYLNVGIYLDDADPNDGCLLYVPGTHTERQPISSLARQHGWNIPGTVEQPARAGDVLVQDMMVLHGSGPKREPGVRRTIYVEYRAAAAVRESGCQSEEWLALREQWMELVYAAARGNAADRDLWVVDARELAVALVERSEPPLPAYYGDEPVMTDHYPIPSDLRSPLRS